METTIPQRNALIEQHLELVKHCAYGIAERLPPGGPLVADLISEGILGLVEAIALFDPARGHQLATYALPRIRGKMLDSLRADDPLSRKDRQHQKLYQQTRDQACDELGRQPTDEEIADRLGLGPDQFRQLWRAVVNSQTTPLELRQYDTESQRQVVLRDLIADQAGRPPEIRLQKSDLLSLVTKGLTRSERLIIILYYWEGLTMKEIGQTLGLSESRVSQMHTSIVDFLRERLRGRRDEFSG